MSSEQNIRDTVAFADGLRSEDLNWKPIYPNNILCNKAEGEYALVLRRAEDGTVFGRKYSILFQLAEDPDHLGEGCIAREHRIEAYILFEAMLNDVTGPLDYPPPRRSGSIFHEDSNVTLSDWGVNEYGSFIRAYPTIELAKKRAVIQFKAVFGYALSHLLPEEGK